MLLLPAMWHYVYVLENAEGRQYVGSTSNVELRLAKHNHGEVSHTSKFRPWKLAHASSFPSKGQALAYEKYLKSGSGTEFRYRHLVPNKRASEASRVSAADAP
ncbi:MAG: GIY-YIG nuclease family protein [Candidatus Peregrinibacteria bacterium]